jgi:antitoxin PrlF
MPAESSTIASKKGTSRLTQKHQVTIPKSVRKTLGLTTGDIVAFEEGPDGEIRLYKVTSLDIEFAAALEDTLSEWYSDADEEAYRHL